MAAARKIDVLTVKLDAKPGALAQVLGAAFRRDRPQYVGQVLHSKFVGRLESVQSCIDLQAPGFALDPRLAACAGHKLRAP